MVDAQSQPQILEHLNKSLTVTIHSTRWIPGTARFVAVGTYARSTGCIQVYELAGPELKLVQEVEKRDGFKCATFGAAAPASQQLATGSFKGRLQVWDLGAPAAPVFDAQAHASIINAVDGFGGRTRGCGPPEIATGGRDGCVRVWDVRQPDAPVAAFEPADSGGARDCWAVALGNSHDDEERCLLAGYDNGDVKMFDLRTNTVRWEANVKNGVCGLQFDRADIKMNKFVAACLESQLHVYDARTQHPREASAGDARSGSLGFAGMTEKLARGTTVWGAAHLPQNRDVFMAHSGDGEVALYRYRYPDQRKVKDQDGKEMGVVGKLERLCHKPLSSQPVNSFDWSPDRQGLFVCSAFDQCVRVGVVTKLDKL
ncbi:WD repeat-containing protein 92 [Monoraphidium neglectum]|uniref:WD repeat-containing protein 92 n=1 Tax=Monoraphidium neglectum TaxID=145388 RepID=A0A0D2LBW8_9CHLO|nr:WD repeat-containing protein 92 [Monoraphidium neglectum]KIZ04239.1 WD repeat-containing protein 92 [Monoraphidium neglectum]|eukprot:XP_013903258.1 WD repeat-containing protein 92 [Monoraphidium neglectum]